MVMISMDGVELNMMTMMMLTSMRTVYDDDNDDRWSVCMMTVVMTMMMPQNVYWKICIHNTLCFLNVFQPLWKLLVDMVSVNILALGS